MNAHICSVCRFGRSNIIIYPCQHLAHARCIFPWPIVVCPICQQDAESVQCLPVQQYCFQGETTEVSNASKVFGVNRVGTWLPEELGYLNLLAKAFASGKIPLEEGCDLSTFLCGLLQCSRARIQSKFGTEGKPFVQNNVVSSCDEVIQYLQLQTSISAAEDVFLASIVSDTDIEEASVICYHIQYMWTRHFILSNGGAFHNPMKEICINDFIHNNAVSSTPCSSCRLDTRANQVVNDMIRCVFRAPLDISLPETVARCTVFLDQSPFDLGVIYDTNSKSILASTFSLQRILSTSSSNLAQACSINHLVTMFNDSEQLLSALINPEARVCLSSSSDVFWHSYYEEPLPIPEPVSLGWMGFPIKAYKRIIPQLTLGNFANAFAVVSVLFISSDVAAAVLSFQRLDPDICIVEKHVKSAGAVEAHIASIHDQVINILQSNQISNPLSIHPSMLGQATAPSIYKRRLLAPVDDGSAYLISSLKEHHHHHTDGDQASSPPPTKRMNISECLRDSKPNDITLISAVQSSVIRKFSSRGSDLDSSLEDEASFTDSSSETNNSSSNIGTGFPSHRLSSAANAPTDPFTRKLRTYLDRLPFDAIELWVPVQTAQSTVMLFGGFACKDDKLQGWSVYSRSFVFEERVGIPGRLCSGGGMEHYADITTLSESSFLRLQGAKLFQLHASLACPLFQKGSSNVVAILYSKSSFPLSDELIETTTNVLRSMKITSNVKQCEFVDDI